MRKAPALPEDRSCRLQADDWLHPIPLENEWEQTGPRAIDLGCGKGRFLLAHAARHPQMRILGIERKLRRIRKMDRKADRAGLQNVRLLRMEANYAMRYLIPENWIDICYIYFPDPWPKDRHADNRLLTPPFLDVLDQKLSPKGVVHFATDHEPYFDDVIRFLTVDSRWKPAEIYRLQEDEISDFELLWKEHNKSIFRYSFTRKQDVVSSSDMNTKDCGR